jgi:uncharacterized membrane protein YtjA (UPF0391 family)
MTSFLPCFSVYGLVECFGTAVALRKSVRLTAFVPVREPGRRKSNSPNFGGFMLYWAAVFFIIAIIAAVFGFGGVYLAAAGIAKVLFFIFLVLFVISLIAGAVRRPRL